MTEVASLADCFALFEALEAERAVVLASLAEWPAECLNFRPAAGKWSAPEVLDHIVRVEAGMTSAIRVCLQSPRALSSEERPGIAALHRALRSENSFTVPAGADAIYPDVQSSLPDVTRRWEKARTELRALLNGLSPSDACCGVFRHPFAGWMTLGEVLGNFSDHLYHHMFQLRRLRAACESSGPGGQP